MEITAALEALRSLLEEAGSDQITVVSDSAYVVNCFRDGWWESWRRRGWTSANGKPVANRDLWEPLLELAVDGNSPVTFKKVAGHAGQPMNELVDKLANEAAFAQRGRSGEHAK
jgi:ribonuclease HI